MNSTENQVKPDFIKLITEQIESLKISLPDEKAEKLNLLGSNMLADPMYPSVSKIFEHEDFAMKHILDSIAPMTFNIPVWKSDLNILDLGTGGGFPVLPLTIMLPNSRFYAVDSRKKSVEFVSRIAKQTGIENLTTVHSRAEELGRDVRFREKLDVVVCRALASVRILLEYCMPLIRVGGYALFYKGPKLDEELAEAGNALKELGVRKTNIDFFRLEPPEYPFSRGFMLIQKKKEVGKKFPRNNGIPVSKPL